MKTIDELITKLDNQWKEPKPADPHVLDIPFLNGIGYILSQNDQPADDDEMDDLPKMAMPDSDTILLLP